MLWFFQKAIVLQEQHYYFNTSNVMVLQGVDSTIVKAYTNFNTSNVMVLRSTFLNLTFVPELFQYI